MAVNTTTLSSLDFNTTTNSTFPDADDNWTVGHTFNAQSIFDIILHCIVYPLVIFVGITGNAFTLRIFSRKESTANNIFIITLTFSDMFLLCTNIFVAMHSVMFYTNVGLSRNLQIARSFVMLLSRISDRLGKLLTAALMFERFTAVYFPLKFKQIWSTVRAWNYIVFIMLSIFLTNVPIITDVMYFHITNTQNDRQYFPSESKLYKYYSQQKPWSKALHTLNKVVFDLVPIIIIFVFSIITACGVRKLLSPKVLKFSNQEMIKRKKQERKITKTLLTIALALCILNSPVFVMFPLVQFKILDGIGSATTDLVAFLVVLNSAINFVIFGIFDKELRKNYRNISMCCRYLTSPQDGKDTTANPNHKLCIIATT